MRKSATSASRLVGPSAQRAHVHDSARPRAAPRSCRHARPRDASNERLEFAARVVVLPESDDGAARARKIIARDRRAPARLLRSRRHARSRDSRRRTARLCESVQRPRPRRSEAARLRESAAPNALASKSHVAVWPRDDRRRRAGAPNTRAGRTRRAAPRSRRHARPRDVGHERRASPRGSWRESSGRDGRGRGRRSRAFAAKQPSLGVSWSVPRSTTAPRGRDTRDQRPARGSSIATATCAHATRRRARLTRVARRPRRRRRAARAATRSTRRETAASRGPARPVIDPRYLSAIHPIQLYSLPGGSGSGAGGAGMMPKPRSRLSACVIWST